MILAEEKTETSEEKIETSEDKTEEETNKDTENKIDKAKDDAKKELENIKGKASDVIKKEIEIPALSIFKIPNGKLSIQQLIVFGTLLIATFFILSKIFIFIPFLNKKKLRILFAIIFTLIPAITGTTYLISNLFCTIIPTTELMEKLGIFWTLSLVIFAIILFITFSSISKNRKKCRKIENAEKIGRRIKQVDAINKIKIIANN